MYKRLLLPLLFRVDAETVHYLATGALKRTFSLPGVPALARQQFVPTDPRLARTVFGLRFPNPVGLAAGFDKNAEYLDEMAALGFGFIEIGTVTPRPQPGNDKPRLFRLPADKGLVNRLGFNNKGVGPAAARLRSWRTATPPGQRPIIGGNIGKNKDTPNDRAVDDYLSCLRELFDAVDYFAVNVSSPNTPGLRDLQEREPLTKLLLALQAENQRHPQPKPILLKIAPDLTDSQLDDIIQIVAETRLAGVIATNTTVARDGLTTDPATVATIGPGGLSGKPLQARSTEVIRYLHTRSGGAFPIIGVGGVLTADDALDKLRAGASLVQLYTGFIYEGPGVVQQICRGLLRADLVPV